MEPTEKVDLRKRPRAHDKVAKSYKDEFIDIVEYDASTNAWVTKLTLRFITPIPDRLRYTAAYKGMHGTINRRLSDGRLCLYVAIRTIDLELNTQEV